jgi:hypothetical protein
MKRATAWARTAGYVTIVASVGEAISLLARAVGLNWFNGATLLLATMAGVLVVLRAGDRVAFGCDVALSVGDGSVACRSRG